MLTIRRRGSEAVDPRTSVLALLPRLHIVSQGRKAAGVAVHGSHGAVLVVLLVLSPPRGPLLVVGLDVEVCEEGDERDHVPDLEVQPAEREGARPDDSEAGLDDGQHKLKQLPLCDVLLPPQVRPHGRDG